MDGETRKPGEDPRILLRLSEQFLRRRYLDDCRKYAHQAYQLDPNFPGVSEILAVADVLLASKHQISTGTLRDWYEVMQLNRYSPDSDLIKQRYDQLYGLLNPSCNKFPFADEAIDIVRNAWYVLSDPLRKAEFDEFLKKLLDDKQSKANSDAEFAFWTACPYCYHLHEFPRAYLELCLRCPNEKCGKAFTCVEIDHPPVEVLKVGKYICSGFVMLGFQNGCWNPFAPPNKQKPKFSDHSDKFVQISDDDDVDEEDEIDDELEAKTDKSVNVNGEGVDECAEGVKIEKPIMRRKKSAARNTKKVTGVGNRVRKEASVHPEQEDDCVFF